jgi:dipeptidyl aminopeptidase/acylaminoacyl peptidase
MPTPFDDLDDYIALPRVSGLAVSPDGSRVVTTVAELNDKRTEYVSAVWELDPAGRRPARRLTRGAKGESSPAFTADGDLLFVAARPTEDDDKPPASLWRLPGAAIRGTLVRIDLATRERITIADDPDADLELPAISPDGMSVAFTRETYSTPDKAPRITLCHMRFREPFTELAVEWDRWPTSVAWSADGSALIVTADENGLVDARDDTRDGRTQLAAPLCRPDPHADAGHPRRQGLSRADR